MSDKEQDLSVFAREIEAFDAESFTVDALAASERDWATVALQALSGYFRHFGTSYGAPPAEGEGWQSFHASDQPGNLQRLLLARDGNGPDSTYHLMFNQEKQDHKGRSRRLHSIEWAFDSGWQEYTGRITSARVASRSAWNPVNLNGCVLLEPTADRLHIHRHGSELLTTAVPDNVLVANHTARRQLFSLGGMLRRFTDGTHHKPELVGSLR